MLRPFLLIIFSLGFMILAIRNTLDDRALAQHGTTGTVAPLEKYTEITSKRRNQPANVSYEADIKIQTETGDVVTVNRKIPADVLSQLIEGKSVPIRYLPEDPHKNRFENEGDRGGSGVIGISVLFLLAGVFWFRHAVNAAPINR